MMEYIGNLMWESCEKQKELITIKFTSTGTFFKILFLLIVKEMK